MKQRASIAKKSRPARKPSSSQTGSRWSRRRFWPLSIVVCLLVFALVAAYALYQVQRPEGVLKRALAKSLQYDTVTINVRQTSLTDAGRSTALELRGPVAASGAFDLQGSYSLAGQEEQGVGLALRSTNGSEAYLRLDRVSQLYQVLGPAAASYGLSADGTSFRALEGTWVTIPASLKDTIIRNRPSDGKTAYSLTESERAALVRLYRQHEFLKIDQVVPADGLGGTADRYRLLLDEVAFTDFARAVQRRLSRLGLSDKQVEALIATSRRMNGLEMLISRDSLLIQEIGFGLVDENGRQTVKLSLDDYGRPVDIKPPSGSIPLLEALTNATKP